MAQDIRALSYEWFEQVWNRRDDTAITRMASKDMICYGLGEDGQPAVGVDQFRRFRQQFLTAFPDVKAEVNDVLVEGDKCAIRLTLTGTHTGDGIGVAPTGNRFTAGAIVLCRWKNGQVIEAWNELDAAGMMRQLQAPGAKMRA